MSANPLDTRLTGLIGFVAEHLSVSDKTALIAQVETATVISEVQGRTVDVAVSPNMPRLSLPDGPIQPIPAVYVGGELSGELIVWIRSGRLIGVERPWFGDEPPNEWPEESSVVFS